MVEFYKTARRWEKEYNAQQRASSGGSSPRARAPTNTLELVPSESGTYEPDLRSYQKYEPPRTQSVPHVPLNKGSLTGTYGSAEGLRGAANAGDRLAKSVLRSWLSGKYGNAFGAALAAIDLALSLDSGMNQALIDNGLIPKAMVPTGKAEAAFVPDVRTKATFDGRDYYTMDPLHDLGFSADQVFFNEYWSFADTSWHDGGFHWSKNDNTGGIWVNRRYPGVATPYDYAGNGWHDWSWGIDGANWKREVVGLTHAHWNDLDAGGDSYGIQFIYRVPLSEFAPPAVSPVYPPRTMSVPEGDPAPTAPGKKPSTYAPLPWPDPLAGHPVPYRDRLLHDDLMVAIGVRQITATPINEGTNYGTSPGHSTGVVVGGGGGPPALTRTQTGGPSRPTRGVKEKKVRGGLGLLQALQGVFHELTEAGDFIGAFYDAIPAKDKKACKAKTMSDKLGCVFKNWDKIDPDDVVVNIVANEIEDRLIGRAFQLNAKAAKARNEPGYKTLNSINGFGGLNDFGKAYGEFSKDYVNPAKKAAAAWLKQL